MKKYFLWSLVLSSITACSATPSQDTIGLPKVGMPNPASQYCIEQGGKLEIKNEENGQIGYCHLPTGEIVEEWALFRATQEKCLPEEAKKLVGQTSTLSDEQVKQLTKSSIVRRVAPGQPVTMDYRDNRVTLSIDPDDQKITQANCG